MKASTKITAVEILALFLLLTVVGVVFLSQREALDSLNRDKMRKESINSISYALEETVKPRLKGYPRTLDEKTLSSIDAALLFDPAGHKVGDPLSDLRYESTGCNGGDVCEGYRLRAILEREADFTKDNVRL